MTSLLSDTERRRISWRLGIDLSSAGLLGVGVLYGLVFPDQYQLAALIQAVAAVLVSAAVLWRGLGGLFQRNPSNYTDQLVALAVLAAFASGDFVTATLVPLILDVGRIFEERSALGAKGAIDNLISMQARQATRLHDGKQQVVAAEDLVSGDVVLLRPGQVIPGDGVVISGRSSIDQSAITGESQPEDVQQDSRVFSGARNINGVLQIRISKTGTESALGKVIGLLQEAEKEKTPFVREIERILAAYLPITLCFAATVLFFTEDLSRAIGVLVASCPTALALAAPSAVVSAMAAAARLKIIVKSASVLDGLCLVDTLAFDKTGTVTTSSLSLSTIKPMSEVEGEELLFAASLCGQISLHPISVALVEHAKSLSLHIPLVEQGQEFPGCGIEVHHQGKLYRLGRLSWLIEQGVPAVNVSSFATVWVSCDAQLLGSIAFVDPLRPEAKQVVNTLREMGFSHTMLITGDRQEPAHQVGADLEINEVAASVLPEAKAALIKERESTGRRVLMIGDGINDALALKSAAVGVAFGSHLSEAALGGADAAIMGADLTKLPWLVTLARKTRSNILQNAGLAICIGVVLLLLAAGGYISPLLAAVFHNGGVLLVIANASRLFRESLEYSSE